MPLTNSCMPRTRLTPAIKRTVRSESAIEVAFLRGVRDDILRQTEWGRKFFDEFWEQYYRISPPIAEEMERDPALRDVMRWSIVTPWISYMRLLVARPDWDRIELD